MSTRAATPAKRTRTGCKTCRQRKLKCDETKPVCGQCRKSNRDCEPSEGIAFRHAQNAGFTDRDGTEKDLSNFYKYRQKFNNDYFLPVPRELSFVHVTDPYAEEHHSVHLPGPSGQQQHRQTQAPPQPQHQAQPSHPQYADVAASSLKAMIDPNLEQPVVLDGKTDAEHVVDSIYPPTTTAEISEADKFNEELLQALKESDEQARDLADATA